MSAKPTFKIRPANENDAPLILSLIKELAEYERLTHEVVATEEDIRKSLFNDRPFAEALIGEFEEIPISFALFFYNFSTFQGEPGIYLEEQSIGIRIEDDILVTENGYEILSADIPRERDEVETWLARVK